MQNIQKQATFNDSENQLRTNNSLSPADLTTASNSNEMPNKPKR